MPSTPTQVLEWLKVAGLDLVDVGIAASTRAPLPRAPNFLVDTAARVRKGTGLGVATSWFITDAKEADAFVREQKLDLVMLARRLLDNPHWPHQAARELGLNTQVLPTPYSFWLQNWSPA